MSLVRKMISCLTYHLTAEEIARALAIHHLAEFSAKGVRFSGLQSDDSIIILGEYGIEDSSIWSDRLIPISEWRGCDTEPTSFLKGELQEKWHNNSMVYIETL